MKSAYSVLSLGAAAAFAAILGSTPALTHASQTDLAQAPLGTAPTVTVLPNLMFILDNSTSMRSDHMPGELNDSTSCKACSTSPCNVGSTACTRGMPPYYAAPPNANYYNPQITWKPGVNSLGVSLGNANINEPLDNIYLDSSTKKTNFTTTYREIYWCTTSSPSTADLTNTSVCRRNGVAPMNNPFVYKATTVAKPNTPLADDVTGGLPTPLFKNPVTKDTHNPFYYEITPREFCEDIELTKCNLQASPSGKNIVPAPVRWCRDPGANKGAADVGAVSGGNPPDCQAKVTSTYKYLRLGNIKRTDIVSSTPTYGSRPNRSDCAAAPNCTYAEEIQNFANWYQYYRTRALLMKTVGGQVFTGLDEHYRVGFVAINVPDSNYYLKIDAFTPAHKVLWYDKFYKSDHISGTPLRQSLAQVGRHFAGRNDGINAVMPDDPVQYSCQQNFALLTSDGYWNSEGGQKIDGSPMDNQDNVDSGLSTRTVGAYDGNLSGASDTLADTAMYYYKTDLRPTMQNNVPTTAKDSATHQHMVTFTLGLGLDGLMTYRPDYETASIGDFAKIKAGNPSGCSWTTGKCDWPVPSSGGPTTLDDMWHAAVNGRGFYFSAQSPDSLKSGLAGALSAIQVVSGTAASSATSTPNITPTDNFIYSSTYRTMKWDGEVVAEKIDFVSGEVLPGVVWSAGDQLDTRVSASSDTRTIYTFSTIAMFPDKVKPFTWGNLSAAQQDFFNNKCTEWSQCPTLSVVQRIDANNGDNLLKWLRGQTGFEGTLFRDREHVLGDTVNAKPAFVGPPNLQYGDATVPSYGNFKTANASRQKVLYIAANDGMLHALNADTGQEMWAYVPRMLLPELYKLATFNYDIKHRYFVDGSPTTMDVFFENANAWKTILVGGLNSGGRGYYALDITDPNSPKGLWEVCADPSGTLQCIDKDDNIGFTHGEPIITKWAKTGQWVVIVSSGYNNVSPGDGKGYIYVIDAETGKILDKKDTGVGDTTTPSGLAKLSGFATNFMVDNTTTLVYGGDLLGNVWRFDMTGGISVERLGQLFDGSTPPKPQSVTTRPEVTKFDAGFNVVYVSTGRMLGGTDLQDPATLVPPEDRAYQQTVYGFKDTGTDLGNLRAAGAKLVQQTLSVIDETFRTVSNNAVDWSTQNGWFVDLNPSNDSPGERVNIDSMLVKGVLIVISNEPNSEPCTSGGENRAYQFDYKSGSYVASAPGQVVGTKLGSALAAGFVVYRLPSGQLKFTEIDVNRQKHTQGVNPGSGGTVGSRVSWRELY